jgi:phosphate transport system permease protein
MSEAYVRETTLVTDESDYFERALDGTVGLSLVSVLVGILALADVIALGASGSELAQPLLTLAVAALGGVGIIAVCDRLGLVSITSQRVSNAAVGSVVSLLVLTVVAFASGMTLARLFGIALLVQAAAVLGAGAASRFKVADTTPDPSAGLLAGLAFGSIGLALGAAIGGSLVGFDATLVAGVPTWPLLTLAAGVGLALVTALPREDVGSTLPAALVVGALGATVTTAAVGVGWQWNPQTIDGGFTGGVVVPLFVLFGSLVSGWAASKARAGFGARGRQLGAFYVINVNAALIVAVMVSIVVFVAVKGIGYAFHGFAIGALSGLVVLAPLLVLALQWARQPAGTTQWHSTIRQLVRVTPLAAVGSLTAVLLGVLAIGRTLDYSFTYTVFVDRDPVVLDTTIAVTPALEVGNMLLVLSGGFLAVYFLRTYGSLRNVGRKSDRLGTVRQLVPRAIGGLLLAGLAIAAIGQSPAGIPLTPVVGGGLVVAGALTAVAFTVSPLAAIGLGDGTRTERAERSARVVTVSLFSALGLLTAAILLEALSGANPSVGPVNVVPPLAMVAALAAGSFAALTGLTLRGTEDARLRRILRNEAVLGLAAAGGFVALFGLHIALTQAAYIAGPVRIGLTGSLSWPMALEPYKPLGAQPGGIWPAVVGTIWLVIGASTFAVPLGVGAAIFLTEYAEQGKGTALVEVATNALWSTPSVVFGLFGAAFILPRLGGDESLLAGMLVLGFMLLPLVLITSREAVKSVPDEYRDASAALGVSRWETIRSVVLPAAMPGVVTGVILGVGRIAGETAPLILVLGSTLNSTRAIDVIGGFRFLNQPPFIINDALTQASAALPTQVWAVIAAGVSGSPSMGWASAFLLLTVVLGFYAVGIATRTYFRRKLNYE